MFNTDEHQIWIDAIGRSNFDIQKISFTPDNFKTPVNKLQEIFGEEVLIEIPTDRMCKFKTDMFLIMTQCN
jgi:hypothetical protein